jgi:hypothetical protein
MNLRRMVLIAGALVALAGLASLLLVFRWHLGTQGAAAVIGAVALAVLLISAFMGWNWLFLKKGRIVVEKWAASHGYRILQCRSPFCTGAFSFWSTSRGQVVYFVTVEDDAGHKRSAWVRCGSFIGSVLSSDEIEVKWNGHETNAAQPSAST